MKQIRLLHCLQTIGSGGVERRRLSLAKLLPKDKYTLKIICTTVQGEYYKEFEKQGVEVIQVGALKSPFHLNVHKKVHELMKSYNPHIIHGAVFEGVTMAAINGFLKKVPIIILEETSDPVTRNWKANYLIKFFGLVADRFIGVSPAATDYLSRIARIPKNKVTLINNGVVVPRKVSQDEIITLKNDLNISPREIVIGSVGRMMMDENKRFSDLIKAFSEILNKGLKVKLILVGDGSELNNYKALAKKLNISDNIIFTGYKSDVSLYYNTFDIFALVSAYESFGLVLAEAMLHELPIVATRVGGMKYIVENEITGFLVDKFEILKIAEKLELLILDKQLRREFGVAGYQRARQNYTEEIYVKNLEALYSELLKKKKLI